jgi:hypothetical protein
VTHVDGSDGARPSPTQELFREVNDQISRISQRFAGRNDLDLLCECGGGCFEHVRVDLSAYEDVRRFPARFLVKPGHASPEADRIVETNAGYDVLEKLGDGAGP